MPRSRTDTAAPAPRRASEIRPGRPARAAERPQVAPRASRPGLDAAPAEGPLTPAEFQALSEFRFQIRRFERFSEDAVQSAGIQPLQYLLLLHVKGFPGREYATVGELADRLQAKPHGVVALVTRCAEHGFVERRPSVQDRRQVEVHLLPAGERLLAHLAALHRAELRSLGSVFPIPRINRPTPPSAAGGKRGEGAR